MLQQLLSDDGSSREEKGCGEKTNRYYFGTDVGESGLYGDAAGAKEVAFYTSVPIVVGEWTRVLPVSEPDAIVVWATT